MKLPRSDETTMIRRLAEHTGNIVIFMEVTSKCEIIISDTGKQTQVMR